jgi:hypothetical protein
MISQKNQPAPLGATYNRGIVVQRSNAKPDAAPNGAKRALFDRGYKDFAPPELGCPTGINPSSVGLFFAFLAIFCG